MRATSPHHRRRRRGAHAVEFAITLPVWVMLISGVAEFGWMFFNQSALDAASNLGCRAGSLIDPGDFDQNLAAVEARANDRMVNVLSAIGAEECDTCAVEARTVGAPPSRSLICIANRDVEPITGMFFGTKSLSSLQVARLEWQREAAPE